MTDPALTIGCFQYDTTQPLFDGSVSADGMDVTMGTGTTLRETFNRLIRGNEFDVARPGLSSGLAMTRVGWVTGGTWPVPCAMCRRSAANPAPSVSGRTVPTAGRADRVRGPLQPAQARPSRSRRGVDVVHPPVSRIERRQALGGSKYDRAG